MTTYGGRNPFRTGYCSPEDMQHNMRMLSQLHDDLGNPVPGGFRITVPDLDAGGEPLLDPDGNPVEHEEDLSPNGLVRFKLANPGGGVFSSPGPAFLQDFEGATTTEEIQVYDVLNRFDGAPNDSVGYAQSTFVGYEIISLGAITSTEITIEGEGDGRVKMDVGSVPKFLRYWLDPVVAPEYSEGLHQLVYAFQDGTADGQMSWYTDRHTSTTGTDPPFLPGTHVPVKRAGGTLYIDPADLVDEKVKVVSGDVTNYLWYQFTTTADGTSEGGRSYIDSETLDPPDGEEHDIVKWDRRNDGGNRTMLGIVPATCNILPGITFEDGSQASGDAGSYTLGEVVVNLNDYESNITAKVWAFKSPEKNHPVLVAKDRKNIWWVIWYGCDDSGEE